MDLKYRVLQSESSVLKDRLLTMHGFSAPSMDPANTSREVGGVEGQRNYAAVWVN